jgi:hypothetical protein
MTDRAGNPVAQPSQLGQDGSSFTVAGLNAAGAAGEWRLKFVPIRSRSALASWAGNIVSHEHLACGIRRIRGRAGVTLG